MLGENLVKIKNSRGGFTLIEIMVAIFLIGVALVGVLSFFNSSLTSNFDAENELIAAGLAQEATEIARNIVDSSYLNNDPDGWYSDLYNKADFSYCIGIDRDVILDTGTLRCLKKPKKKANIVCFDPIRGTYQMTNPGENCQQTNSNWKDSGFTRDVVITSYDANGGGINLDTGDCLSVAAKVSWSNGNKNTTATDIICKPRQ